MTEHSQVEALIERLLTASRWLLAPFFIGLALGLVILLLKFLQELYHLAVTALTVTEAQAILGVLTLVDLALTGALVLIVIFSGYENFVSRIDHTRARDWPSWMASIDFTSLKIKLLGSIVAISAIQLLKQFMAIGSVSDRDLWWSTGIHLVFVVSSVLLALSDRLSASHVEPEGKDKAPPSDGAGNTH
ncbi:MAG: TIGR00645 family protein [Hyphomicrobiaceae bacterium]